MKVYTIYKISNTTNGKCYIGFDSNWPNRIKNHIRSAEKNRPWALSCAIRKHGWDSFNYQPIYQSLDRDHTLNVMEEYFIREYNSYIDNAGYNMSYGGDGNNNFSAEVRWKMGSANRGKRRPCSEETKRKISEAKKGICTVSDEQKEALRLLYTGTKRPESAIRKNSKDYIATSPEGIIYEFYNLNRFCKDHGLNQGAMAQVALGKKASYKGWKCKQIDKSS